MSCISPEQPGAGEGPIKLCPVLGDQVARGQADRGHLEQATLAPSGGHSQVSLERVAQGPGALQLTSTTKSVHRGTEGKAEENSGSLEEASTWRGGWRKSLS